MRNGRTYKKDIFWQVKKLNKKQKREKQNDKKNKMWKCSHTEENEKNSSSEGADLQKGILHAYKRERGEKEIRGTKNMDTKVRANVWGKIRNKMWAAKGIRGLQDESENK